MMSALSMLASAIERQSQGSSRPLAEAAPTAIKTGAAGSGRPISLRNTISARSG